MPLPSIKQLIDGVPSSLGSYGPVLDEIEEALESPQCSLVTMGDAIEKDPDLTARLLRLGNSSFYGFSSRLTTVTEAISLIGIQQVQDLILASSIIERFVGVADEFVSMESFWRHSLACGIGARLIAMERRLPKADKFFVAGLLHDVGRLALYSQAPEAALQVFQMRDQENLLLRDAETKVLGYNHQQVGDALLRHWKYPANLVAAVGYHHQPAAVLVGRDEASAVHLSDFLVNAMQIGTSGERVASPLNAKAWEALRFSPELLAPIMTGIDEQIEAVQDVFLSKVRANK
jgi:HD-like signal output (HDOD) protein